MGKALSGTLSLVLATVLGLATWQLVVLALALPLLLMGVATLVLVFRIHRSLELITRDQEIRVDALGRKRSDRLKGD